MGIQVKCVIGANYGDEGKGLMTDYFSQQAKSLVVLSNGGAQRGHTVKFKDGRTHVFHHFGSGTLSGADTYLPEYFILNPILFMQEWLEFDSLPKVYVCPTCRLSTPFDMILNQIIEENRGVRHGSCGLGIWETLLRSKNDNYRITFKRSVESIRKTLYKIRDIYLLDRLAELNIILTSEWKDVIFDEGLIENYLIDFRLMLDRIHLIDKVDLVEKIGREYSQVIFENGQGLLLDQSLDREGYRTTPSKTGIANCFELINSWTKRKPELVDSIECCYVTRSYLTKHGAGEFKEEDSSIKFEDDTNQPNLWQGIIRFGKLDFEEMYIRCLNDYLSCDLKWAKNCKKNFSFAATHMNEVELDFGSVKPNYVSYSPFSSEVKGCCDYAKVTCCS